MWMPRSRFDSSMNGRFSSSVIVRHCSPSRLLISELCIFGFSWAIFRRCPRDHTMKAFIGLFTLSSFALLLEPPPPFPPPPTALLASTSVELPAVMVPPVPPKDTVAVVGDERGGRHVCGDGRDCNTDGGGSAVV